ncbi:MAG: hypothetical protein PHI50_00175 [Alphaproteobacteria bacterium]|nr:hypothetical protein [Alphaproteobacteria bacterium]
MKPNFIVFTELCKEKKVPYRMIQDCRNLLEIQSRDGKSHLFIAGSTPFNSQSVCSLCRDKEFFYNYYKASIKMPKTRGFVKPTCSEEWREYLKFKTIDEVVEEGEKNFTYPFVTKMNKGSQGKCVFKVNNNTEFRESLEEIYKEDYVALVQEYVDIKSEYRIIYLNKKLMFAYKKNNENAAFVGNMSPLHFAGAYAEIVDNQNLLTSFDNFVQPMLAQNDIPYCGLDVVLDKENKMWLIEGNASPAFGYFLQNPKGHDILKSLYTEMFKSLNILPQNERSCLTDILQKGKSY